MNSKSEKDDVNKCQFLGWLAMVYFDMDPMYLFHGHACYSYVGKILRMGIYLIVEKPHKCYKSLVCKQ